MLEFSESKVLFDIGHTLSLIKRCGTFIGYLGHVDFDRIDIYTGHNLYNMRKAGELKGYRWGSAVVHNGKVFMFCTRQAFLSSLPLVNPYKYQSVFLLESKDGIIFEDKGKVLDGSAPFIWEDKGLFYLFFHRRNPHRIMFRRALSPKGINENFVSELIADFVNTLSAPSLVCLNGEYLLTCEFRRGCGNWQTILFKGNDLSELKKVKNPFLFDGACAFQHIFGDRYVLTYSVPNDNGDWRLMVKEAEI